MLHAVNLTQYWRETDGWTDGQTEMDGIAVASTALAMRRAVKTAGMQAKYKIVGYVDTKRENNIVFCKKSVNLSGRT